MRKMFPAVCLSLIISRLPTPFGRTSKSSEPNEPAHLTSEQDHQRLMDQLHITTLRRGADGDPTSPFAANYNEAKANLYADLPNPLVSANGTKITTAEDVVGATTSRARTENSTGKSMDAYRRTLRT